MKSNCEEIYLAVVRLEDRGNYTLFDLAECFISGFPPEKLRDMLASDDGGVVSDGLFVLGEVGALARQFSEDILRLQNHEDASIRMQAKKLGEVWLAS